MEVIEECTHGRKSRTARCEWEGSGVEKGRKDKTPVEGGGEAGEEHFEAYLWNRGVGTTPSPSNVQRGECRDLRVEFWTAR